MSVLVTVDVPAERQAVVTESRSWETTPFHHGQRLKGAGVDCAQLLLGVYGGLGLVDPPRVDYYSPDWFLHTDLSPLEGLLREYCVQVSGLLPGDIAAFKFGRAVSHAAIALEWPLVLHADRVIGCVAIDTLANGSSLTPRLAGFWRLKRWTGGVSALPTNGNPGPR